MRDLLAYAKDRLDSQELKSNVALYRACVPLARLMQISRLLNVDDLEDVLDLISSSKRKGNWDLKLDDSKAFLSLRREFAGDKVNELLRIDDD
jgi:conserved oligomeric Golgi complex subunit 4